MADTGRMSLDCMHFVYIIRSQVNNKTYTGSTSVGVEKRLHQHNIGSNKWTKSNGPFELVYYETYVCKQDAILREKFYKSGIGKQIKKLILENFNTKRV